MILILTIDDDLHGLAVQACLRSRGLQCHLIASDNLANAERLSIMIGDELTRVELATSEGRKISPQDAEVLWLRRPKALQQLNGLVFPDHQRNLINNDTNGALSGALQIQFRGTWISDPTATERASNKVTQLHVAVEAGMRVPETLISQSTTEVSEFYHRLHKRIIVKPVVGTPGPLVFTQIVSEEHLLCSDSIRACPAIYQEFVPGTRHIRLNQFGDDIFAFSIDSPKVDWRPDLNVPVNVWPVPTELRKKTTLFLERLNLRMGILDFKETPEGEIVFFEVNPQGQFLFLEGLTKSPLTERFADFLEQELAVTC